MDFYVNGLNASLTIGMEQDTPSIHSAISPLTHPQQQSRLAVPECSSPRTCSPSQIQ